MAISLLVITPVAAGWITYSGIPVQGWDYRKSHHINSSSDGALTTYQDSVTVYRSAGSDSGNDVYVGTKCEADYDDIRITASDGTTYLDMWVEEGYTSSSAEIWFEIPSLPASGGYDIYIYYGNEDATAVSNGTATFTQFQNFNAASLPSGWEAGGQDATSPTVSYSSGYMRVLASTTSKIQWVQQDTNASVDSAIYETRIRTDYNNNAYVIEAVTIRDGLGYPPIILAGYSYQSGSYRNNYTNYDGSWGTSSTINGWSEDAWHISTLKRTGSAAVWYVDRANETSVSSHYPTNASPFQYQVYGSTSGSTYYGRVDVDWFFARDYTANEPAHSTWGSEEENTITGANFTSNVTSGDAPLTVQFNGSVTGGAPNAWYWDFDDDGDWDDVCHQNPNFTYYGGLVPGYLAGSMPDEIDIGLFNVSLYAWSGVSNDTEEKTDYITVNYAGGWLPDPLPAPSISANVTSGTAPLSVSFTGSATNVTPTSWKWDIDGDSSTPYDVDGDFEYSTQNATHTYNAAGLYTVRLKAVCADGYTVGTETNYINVSAPAAPPVAAFSVDDTTALVGQTLTFTDSSSNAPTSWAWDFDLNGVNDSVLQNPTYSYGSAGTFSVKLTATNADGSDNETKIDYITVTPLVSGFTCSDTTPETGDVVTFTDTSSPAGAIAWWWDFDNDGITDSILEDDTYIYAAAGVYTVNHTVLSDGVYDSEVKVGYITVSAPGSGPTPTPTVGGGLHFTGNVTLIPTSNASQYYDTIMAGNMTMGEIGAIIPQPLVDALGGGDAGWGLLYFIVFGTAFLILFGRQKNVLIPGLVFILASFFFIQYVLSEELVWIAYALCAAALTGVIVFIALGRR